VRFTSCVRSRLLKWVTSMKIEIEGQEITDAQISKISLVKHGAIRAPFKIVKSRYAPPPYAVVPPQDHPHTGGPYAENSDNPMHSEPHRYATDRHGAQAAQVAPNPLGIVKDHSFEGMFSDAARRKRGRW
jgi:hypothetical protein